MTADEMRALTAAATPGPWETRTDADGFADIGALDAVSDEDWGTLVVGRDPEWGTDTADAELIVWLRNHADALADLIDAVDVTWGFAKLVGVNRSDWVVRAEDMAAMRDAIARVLGWDHGTKISDKRLHDAREAGWLRPCGPVTRGGNGETLSCERGQSTGTASRTAPHSAK